MRELVDQAEPGQRSLVQHGLVIGDQRGAGIDRERPPAARELPAVHRSHRPEAVLQAGVLMQVVRRLRRAVAGEVIGRGRHEHPQRAGHGNRHHVLVECLAKPQAGVETFGDQVDEAVVGDQIDADRRIGAHEVGQDRPQRNDHRRMRTGQPQRADRGVALGAGVLGGRLDLRERRRHARQQPRAGLGQADMARGPLQQPHAQSVFQVPNGLGDRRGAHAQRAGGSRKAAKPRHAGEGGQRGQGIRIDCEVRLHDACSVARCFR
ncbi:hypothetical protein D3C72_1230150 [compost metagenome]